MTEETETTPRRRGRPRKVVEDHQPEVPAIEELPEHEGREIAGYAFARELEDENEAMQNQIRFQLKALMQMAAKLGIDPYEGFEKPPAQDTVVVEPDEPEPVRTVRPKPGTILGNPGDRNPAWVPWSKEDLDKNDTVTFVPQPIPSLVFPALDEEGRQKIRLDVNDLVCWLTVGIQNTVNRMFWNVYNDAYQVWRELEHFKRNGPVYAPWATRGPDGRPAWYYDPMTISFGIDEDGHSMTPFRNSPLRPMREAEEAI